MGDSSNLPPHWQGWLCALYAMSTWSLTTPVLGRIIRLLL